MTFTDPRDAQDACAMNGYTYDGNKLFVQPNKSNEINKDSMFVTPTGETWCLLPRVPVSMHLFQCR